METRYSEFLATKAISAPSTGLKDIPPLNPKLFPFQSNCVTWALRRGRAALFCDCGLGKSAMALEWATHVPGRVLILTPLAVAKQFVREAEKFNIPNVAYARSQSDSNAKIVVTNYEMLKNFDVEQFSGVVLDESSILKNYMGMTKRLLIETFKNTRFKLACTAVPSPNSHMELGNHADFLDVMPSNEMLARWFINDTMHFGNYRLKAHGEKDFWEWISSWAACVSKPSDLGYSDDGFILPPLMVHEDIIAVDQTKNAKEGELFRSLELSATNIHAEMRITAPERAARAAELVNGNEQYWIVWCNTNYEADELQKLIPEAIEVRGDMKLEIKEQRLLDFADGKFRVLLTKPSIAGHGMNFQHCANLVFVGLSYSFEALYQALRRSYRFMQTKPVHAHIIVAETERAILDTIKVKIAAHETMQSAMLATVNKLGTVNRKLSTERTMDIEKGRNWQMMLGDCVERIKEIADNSIDFSVFSPPFANLYIYSDSIYDLGNSTDDAEFLTHYSFLCAELLRVIRPGRLIAVHCKDLVNYKGRDGRAGLRDFPGTLIRTMTSAGLQYHSRVTVWKDPVIEMQRTKAHGLLYKQLRADSTFSRQGLAEYVLLFRKWASEEDESLVKPVTHTHESFPLDQWQQWASPVWMDIRQTNVLNCAAARSEGDERHICPLQLDLIERAVHLWSNEGDLVLSPFAGIGSEGVGAIQAGRRFIGIELKRSYYEQACRNLEAANREQHDLFMEITE